MRPEPGCWFVRPMVMRLPAIQRLLEPLLDLFYPKVCSYCGDPFQQGLSNVLCRSCFFSQNPYLDPVCRHCGLGLPAVPFEGSSDPRCRDCGEEDYQLDQVRAFGPYAGPWRIAHHAFKFDGMEGLAHPLAARLLEAIPWRFWDGVEGLVPVPLGPDRMRKRGYNPAERLAKVLGEKLSIPLLPLLRKARSTPPQMSLERARRWRNPKGAYRAVRGRLFPDRVLLVDDVFTTGATLEECARVLKSAGVKVVKAVVLGRTEHHA